MINLTKKEKMNINYPWALEPMEQRPEKGLCSLFDDDHEQKESNINIDVNINHVVTEYDIKEKEDFFNNDISKSIKDKDQEPALIQSNKNQGKVTESEYYNDDIKSSSINKKEEISTKEGLISIGIFCFIVLLLFNFGINLVHTYNQSSNNSEKGVEIAEIFDQTNLKDALSTYDDYKNDLRYLDMDKASLSESSKSHNLTIILSNVPKNACNDIKGVIENDHNFWELNSKIKINGNVKDDPSNMSKDTCNDINSFEFSQYFADLGNDNQQDDEQKSSKEPATPVNLLRDEIKHTAIGSFIDQVNGGSND
jgi:hypothetical protein